MASRAAALIERSPEIRKGRPRIAGTGVTVMRIAGWSNLGPTPEEIVAKFDHLTLAQIHAALAYYHANREEINSEIADEEAAHPPPKGSRHRHRRPRRHLRNPVHRIRPLRSADIIGDVRPQHQ